MSTPGQSASGTVSISIVWLVGLLAGAGGLAAAGIAMKYVYSSKLADYTSVSNERDNLRSLNTKLTASNTQLTASMAQLVDRSALDHCEDQLAKVRSIKNDAVHESLVDLDRQQQQDVDLMRQLADKRWKNEFHQLTEADDISYNTAQQRWQKYPDDRTMLLKQLVCVP
jgi:hypothetical protein